MKFSTRVLSLAAVAWVAAGCASGPETAPEVAQAVQALGHVAEGVYSARTVLQRAQHLGVPMPITQGVVDLLDGRLQPAQAVMALMGREPTAEGG